MTRVQDQLVAGILEQVHEQLSPTSYNVWFRNATHLALADNELSVGVPNLFVCDYMESRFARMITDIARAQIGPDVSVRFHIDPELFRERRRSELAQTDEFLSEQSAPATPAPQPAASAASDRPDDRPDAPFFTLDRFVVGNCNRIAHAAALEVAERPGSAYNPLFIHGGCGLGKTHLLQGIVHAVRDRHGTQRVLYITAEQFTNRYIMAVKTRSLDAFRNRFRRLDVLAIDDIHFLANKEATQEEFLHTFNACHLGNRQVVMASDCHPKMLGAIQDSLVSRFVSGMIAHVAAPDRRTRVEILERKAHQMAAEVPDDALTYLAEHTPGSVRELEGGLIRVIAYASLDRRPINLALAQEALADHISASEKTLHVTGIVDTVAAFFAVPAKEIIGRKRTRTFTIPRQVAMYLARRLTALSFPEIGRLMGGKNHTTVMAACKRVEQMLTKKEPVAWHSGSASQNMTAPDLIDALQDRLRS